MKNLWVLLLMALVGIASCDYGPTYGARERVAQAPRCPKCGQFEQVGECLVCPSADDQKGSESSATQTTQGEQFIRLRFYNDMHRPLRIYVATNDVFNEAPQCISAGGVGDVWVSQSKPTRLSFNADGVQWRTKTFRVEDWSEEDYDRACRTVHSAQELSGL